MQVASIFVSILAIGSYLLWNAHLRNLYGSLFLNSLMPATSWSDAADVIDIMRWRKFRYFSEIQHFLVAESLLASIAYMVLNKKKISRKSLIWFVAIYTSAHCFSLFPCHSNSTTTTIISLTVCTFL